MAAAAQTPIAPLRRPPAPPRPRACSSPRSVRARGPKSAKRNVSGCPPWAGRLARRASPRLRRAEDFPPAELAEAAAESKDFAENGRIALNGGRPVPVGQDDHASSLRAIVLRADETAEDR